MKYVITELGRPHGAVIEATDPLAAANEYSRRMLGDHELPCTIRVVYAENYVHTINDFTIEPPPPSNRAIKEVKLA